MILNGFDSDDYIYLELNNDLNKEGFGYKKGQIIRYKREELSHDLFSRLIYQGIFENLDFVPKESVVDGEILPHQLNSKIYFKEDTRANLCLWPKERYCLNEWMIYHLTNSDELEISLVGPCGPRNMLNLQALDMGTQKLITDKNSLPMIEIRESNVHLIFTFKKGEELDFTDPGVISLLMDRKHCELLANSRPIIGEEKEKIFAEDFKNAFIASDGIFYEDSHIYHYYKINDDIKVKDIYELPTYRLNKYLYDEQGYLRYVFIEEFKSMDFSRDLEQTILSFATEVPYEEAIKMHENRLVERKREDEEQLRKWHKEREDEKKKLIELYEQQKNNADIFPGSNGHFVHNYQHPREYLYTLKEIKRFFENLVTLDKNIVDQMYFYGGTLPYIVTDAQESRDFGDIDIFVPVSQMESVRKELRNQPSFHVYCDSKDLTMQYKLTTRISKKEVEEDNSYFGLELLGALCTNENVIDDNGDTALEAIFRKTNDNVVYQDFGLKASLFGVDISIFPLYEYEGDLMAKSFNISDVYNYLLAVRVMNNTTLDSFAKNICIYNNRIKILPFEYTIISKASAISSGYIKREDKDAIDLKFIEEHAEQLGISEEKIEELKRNYPDYSIALAYYLNNGRVEKLSGERYKELMLINKGRYLS